MDEQLTPDQRQQQAKVQKWIGAIATYEREFKRWEQRAAKIVKIYRDHDTQQDATGTNGVTFNILWSNVQTAVPAVFARLPKPDVSRRFRDNDPVGRVASLILERALEYEIEHYPDYRAAMENSVLDRFLGGRGVAWVRYEPHFRAAEQGMPEDGVQVTDDADEAEETPEAQEEVDYECAPVDYVHWKDFGHTIARTWEEVTGVWRKVYMSRPALVERFGEEIGSKVPLDTRPDEKKNSSGSDEQYQACVFEIWDKATNTAIWLSKSMGQILDERQDPLKLECFFPCPRPLFATLTTDSLIPVPDFKLYQDQAKELNVLADRIDGLIKALRVRGIYDASVPELQRLFSEGGDNELIPVKNWHAFAEKNGLSGAIDLVDLTPIVKALNESYTAVDQVKNQIYEIMGIADIIRGSTDPDETLGAQRLKGQFGSLRLRAMQGKVGQFATEILQIKAQIICKQFQPETILRISAADQLSPVDQQLIPQAIQLLVGERAVNPELETEESPLSSFRIEVSADSMVQMDEMQEKQDRMEFLKATSQFLQQAIPAIQATPQIGPLLGEMLKFGVGAFKVGKTMEGAFDAALEQMRNEAANPQQKPDPETVKAQSQQQMAQMQAQLDERGKMIDAQMEERRMQMEAQLEQQRMNSEMAVEQHRQEMQARENAHQQELEAQRDQLRMQHEAALEQMRQQAEERDRMREKMFQRWKTELEAAVKVEVANISSKAKMQDAATETSTNEISSEVRQ